MQTLVFSVKAETRGDWSFENGGFKMIIVENKVTRGVVGLQSGVDEPTIR